MKNNITLTNDEVYTALIALNLHVTLISKSPVMDEKSKSREAARVSALIDKLKKLVQHE